MILSSLFEVVVILSVLLSFECAFGGDVTSALCEFNVKNEVAIPTLNCSRRNIDKIPDWPDEIQQIPADSHVLITFLKNDIVKITQLPSIPGSQIAVNFKNNQLVDIEPGAFSNLDKLFFLDLSNNRLTGEVLRGEIFQGPYKSGVYGNIALESLYLSNNQIHSLDRYLFQYTPNLTRLYLNNNPIEILDHVTLSALSTASKLQVLDLSYTGIESIPHEAFKGLVQLNSIDLSGNKFATVPQSLRVVRNTLEYLTFNNNPIVELSDDSFVDLINLKELEIAENLYLEEIKSNTFSPLKNLKVLHLCHNQNLRYISHNAFRGMKDKWTLSQVFLDDNNLSELSTDLMLWNQLDTLGMTGNKWVCNCDLANIVTTQGAGEKFKRDSIPYCAAPMKLSGEYVTNITLTFCPAFDKTFDTKRGFTFYNLKPKHVLWSIVGVAMIVVLGMLLGTLVNALKACYVKRFTSQPIRYINLRADSGFA